MRVSRTVLTLVLLIVLFGNPTQALEDEQAMRLRPPLGIVLERYEKGMDIRSAAGFSGTEFMADGRLPCFVRFQDVGVTAEALGFEAQTKAGAICTARLLPEEILILAGRSEVSHISMAVQTQPLLDISIPEINADQVHQSDHGDPPVYSGSTGVDVVVGIIDSGIDHQHPDFWVGAPASPRILSIWDQTTGGTPPPGFGYGNECDQPSILGGTCTEADIDGHGTHVAGIAAGNGAATGNMEPPYQFVGTAPQADIIAVKSSFYTSDVVDGVNYIFGEAAGLGKPAVVNLSLGTHYGPHDGTADFDVLLTNLVGNGEIIVAAAGNEMGDSVHAEVSVAQGNTETVTFRIPEYTPIDGSFNDVLDMDGWYTGGSQLTLTLTSPPPGNHVIGPVSFGMTMGVGTLDGQVTIDNGTWNPPNGDENFHIEIIDGNPAQPPAAGIWTLEIEGSVVPAGADALVSEADMWLYFWTMSAIEGPEFLMGVEEAEIIGSPATADSVIAVGCYTTRIQWPSIDGNNYQYTTGDQVDHISLFSSIGPRRDGWLKPDITAPGMGIFSALSADASVSQIFTHPDGVHFLTQGTSMASPHVAGVVALIYESLGPMYTEKALYQLTRGARSDEHTGDIPNDTWGWGKLDAQRSTQVITPVLIQGLSASPEPWGVLISWSSPGDLRPQAFRVLRALDDGSAATELLERAKLAGEVAPDGQVAAFEDRALLDSGRYAYWIQAIFQGEPEAPAGPVYVEWTRLPVPAIVLHPASPNPFRPNTTLHLELAQRSQVVVEIIDPLGRRVRTLEKGILKGGPHTLEWDGRDEKGREAGSGLYFVRVKAGDVEQVGRLVLIR